MLTHARLLELLHYDPETGDFTWIAARGGRPGPKAGAWHIGKKAGHSTGKGYVGIEVDGSSYKAHRLAWFYVTGAWPKDQIDHKDRVRSNNRFENLREATGYQNSGNARRQRNNTTGFKGVHEVSPGRFQARIGVGGRVRHIACFGSPEEAHAAYVMKARELFGEFHFSG